MSMSGELWRRYKDWINEELMDQLSELEDQDVEEWERYRDELYEKYGPTYKLRKDAPQDAIDAVMEEDRIFREAEEMDVDL